MRRQLFGASIASRPMETSSFIGPRSFATEHSAFVRTATAFAAFTYGMLKPRKRGAYLPRSPEHPRVPFCAARGRTQRLCVGTPPYTSAELFGCLGACSEDVTQGLYLLLYTRDAIWSRPHFLMGGYRGAAPTIPRGQSREIAAATARPPSSTSGMPPPGWVLPPTK